MKQKCHMNIITGKKARQFDINEMMAVAKRRAADAAEEQSKAKGEKMLKIWVTFSMTICLSPAT
jgi:hypothetical protein